MSKWNNSTEWQRLRSESGCPICNQEGGRPWGVTLEMDVTYFVPVEDGLMKGHSCLFLKRHAVELHELSDDESTDFMHDVRRVSKALFSVIKPEKMNYYVAGNTIPHLHMHFYPRQLNDPYKGGPIDPQKRPSPVYADGEFSTFASDMLKALKDKH